MSDKLVTFFIMLLAVAIFATPFLLRMPAQKAEPPIPPAFNFYIPQSTTTFPAVTAPATTTIEAPDLKPTPASLPAGVLCLEDCPLIVPERVPAGEVEAQVRNFFKDTPVLIAIAKCESEYRQHKYKGVVLTNEQGSSATGVMQIMASYHQDTAANLGHDIQTTQGNMAYAYHLYNERGTQPWDASRNCWDTDRTLTNNVIL